MAQGTESPDKIRIQPTLMDRGGKLVVRWLVLLMIAGVSLPANAWQADLRHLFPRVQPDEWSDLRLEAALESGLASEMLLQLDNIAPAVLTQAAQANSTSLQTTAEGSADQAGRVFHFEGKLGQVRRTGQVYPTDDRDREILLVEVQVAENLMIEILTAVVPRALQSTEAAGQPVSGTGVLLGERDGRAVLAARRLRWHPGTSDRLPGVGAGQIALSRAGMDVGLLDDVRQYSAAALTPAESAVFAELMQSVVRLKSIPAGSAAALNLAELAGHPDRHTGDLVRIDGQVRRITPVMLNEADPLRAAIGDRYHQLDVFLPLGNQTVVLGGTKEGEEVLEIHGSYGVTVLLPQLPDGLADQKLPQRVSIDGFFLKVWQHRTLATREISDQMRRPNLIFLAAPQEVRADAFASRSAFSWWMAAFWVLLVTGIVALILRGRESSSTWRKRVRQRERKEFDPQVLVAREPADGIRENGESP